MLFTLFTLFTLFILLILLTPLTLLTLFKQFLSKKDLMHTHNMANMTLWPSELKTVCKTRLWVSG